ncbi:MAG: carboxypeptidase regulatory-like domain-containing protein [Bacteroidetes bacterium]|nr:carboxypeptidase regulatory-like domain-containing protein [Bacteroidota bacterium]
MRALIIPVLLASLGASAQQKPTAPPPPEKRVQVFGSVTDAVSGKPVYECLVEHYDLQGKRWSVTTVNSDGRYALFLPTGVPFELRVTRENGYAELDQRVEAIAPGTRTYEQPLRLSPK